MSYNKQDFLHWDDDIDLDYLLGEYTCSESEVELSEEDIAPAPKRTKNLTKCDTEKTYKCSDCQNQYSSISGLRGHLRNKHGILNIKGKFSLC